MVWCPSCQADCPTGRDGFYITCMRCGKVVSSDDFTEEPTFVKGPGGEAIAVERSFTKGRRTDQVAAACLYIACRSTNKCQYLLIDFSICLRINVYVLGAVFLQLCKLLSVQDHPIVQKPVDPSLFMSMFTSRLMGFDNRKVSNTAIRIVAGMKQDWLQTGRKPSGLCGAALYISALSHGLSYSKSDIVEVVHICEATLAKRLTEFENTGSGSLTIEEFNKTAKELENEDHAFELSAVDCQKSSTMEVLCEHKGRDPYFACGLCKSCYQDFIELSGGLNGGSDPPAFQHAERERLAKVSAVAVKESDFVLKPPKKKTAVRMYEADLFATASQNVGLPVTGGEFRADGAIDTYHNFKEMSSAADETESLSDIDDAEVNGYLNSEEESRYKKIIWEEMNKEYLQEQAAKEAAAAAAIKDFSAASGDFRAACELTSAAAAAVGKLKEEKRRERQALEAKNAGPAQTAAEATRNMLTKKRLSSKINYDVLETLFDDDLAPDAKRNHPDSHHDRSVTGQQPDEEETKSGATSNNDDQGQDDEYMEVNDYDYGAEVNDCDYDVDEDYNEILT
ncbi:transcription factor IIIB 60 kDa subunit-like [Cornus florida]|uniref:transcription factor IIIB 60 kDa subunit-like n=1 Tax=Cornus florida TaxID=4283 RepID=UPI0028A1F9D6|nr:transcription factor IIIB 60 kDa subunit-like [Cornus florida]